MPAGKSILRLLFIICLMAMVLFLYTLHFLDAGSGNGYLATYIDETHEVSEEIEKDPSFELVFDNRDNIDHAVQYELVVYSASDRDWILTRSHFYYLEIGKDDKVRIDLVAPDCNTTNNRILEIHVYDLTIHEEFILESGLY